jgi:cell division protein FtsB
MSIESLTYADLAGRLGTSHEAARSLVRRLRLPRQMGNDGTVRVNIDLAEIQYKPLPQRSPGGQRVDFEALKARIEQLQAQVTKLETEKSSIEAIAVGHRADFERERERSDTLMTNTMTLAAVAMSARAKAARLESELSARRSKFWTRLRTRRRAPASQQFRPNAPPRPEEPIMQLERLPAAAGRVRTFAELAALVMFAALITVFVEYGIPFLIQ